MRIGSGIRRFVLAALVLLTPAAAQSAGGKTPHRHPGVRRFVVVCESDMKHPDFGMLMVCPAHAHGPPKQAVAKLKRLLSTHRRTVPSTIWVCRANQMRTLITFAPLVDRVVVNPFVFTSKKPPGKDDRIWPTFDHPHVNYLREVRRNTAGTALLACIDVDGESHHFSKRSASFEEIKWLAYAAVGANFQGIVWRGDLDRLTWGNRLRQIGVGLRRHAADLGQATPVKWVTDRERKPMSALCSVNTLFVILLTPEYLATVGVHKTMVLPTTIPEVHGELELAPPAGVDVTHAHTLMGLPAPLHRAAGRIRVNYAFKGPGKILVFRLSRRDDSLEGAEK